MQRRRAVTLPDHDPGDFPEDFSDPVADESLPHITAYDITQPDPVPPADRLDEEPADVEVDL